MTLADLILAANQLKKSIKIADEALDNDELNRLWGERAALNLLASYLRPSNEAEICFLGNKIVEYAEFLRDVPSRDIDRVEALEAIERMSNAIAGVFDEQEQIAA